MRRQAKGLSGDLVRNPLHFIKDSAGLDNCNPLLRGSFTLSHPGFGRLVCERLVRENSNPDFSTSFHMSGEGNPGGLDLTISKPATISCQKPVISMIELIPAVCFSLSASFLDFAVFYFFRH